MLPKDRPPTHPGRVLAETLSDLDMSQRELAKKLGVTVQTVNTLVRGKRGMTARIAVGLGRLLKTTPQYWMNMQVSRDLWFALHAGDTRFRQEDAR